MQAHANSRTPASRKLERTNTPGVFRRGGSYVVVYRDPSGRQRKRSARTITEAKALKAQLSTDIRRGEYRALSNIRFDRHWQGWLDSYAGRTARGFRENTRADYRRELERFAVPFFGQMRLAEIEPSHIKSFLHKLARKGLAASTIRNALAPVRAMLADAAEDGLIRSNPAAGVRIPAGTKTIEPRRKELTENEVARLLDKVPTEHRLLVELLLETGVRISEALGWQWRDFDGKRLHVERRSYRGLDAPKSSFGKRPIPLTAEMARRLWQQRKGSSWNHDRDPIFASREGCRLDYANLYNRVLKPAREAAGIPYGGFHRLRHTCGTRLHAGGARPDQVQRWLGHHDLAFTMRTYVHPDVNDLPDPERIFGSTEHPPGADRTDSDVMSVTDAVAAFRG